ncbi:MAG TPA: helix-turn-helix domain-containing protein [Terracidiphilus sp.]|nr:helix-turn-helix domain-containing protein [Terracidiphilus sp.]
MDTKGRSKNMAELAAQVERVEGDLGAIRRAMRKPVEAEVIQGALTVPQIAVMHEVVHHHGISLKDLSRRVSLAHSTVSGIVDRLEKRGLIERRPDQRDGRVSSIFPSAPVTQFVSEQIPALTRGPLQQALKRATGAERDLIERALRRLRELLNEA